MNREIINGVCVPKSTIRGRYSSLGDNDDNETGTVIVHPSSGISLTSNRLSYLPRTASVGQPRVGYSSSKSSFYHESPTKKHNYNDDLEDERCSGRNYSISPARDDVDVDGGVDESSGAIQVNQD